jgi:[ribosomal protein S18]-alanine N-acetyltransferase
MTIVVRAGSADDVESLMPVMQSAFDPRYGEAWSIDQFLAMLSLPGTKMSVAENAEDVVGFALWRTIVDECELLLIAVRPQGQKKGSGKALLQTAVTESKSEGCHRLFVEVRTDNPAVAFYQNFGFEQCGFRNNYYRRSDGGPTGALTLRLLI